MERLICTALVFLGGGTGCVIRLMVDGTSSYAFSPSNIAACLLIGITYGVGRYGIATNKYWLSFCNVGFLGGLSTFTPLAIYSLGQEQESIFMAMVLMAALLLGYTAMTVASATVTSTLVKVLSHGKYQLKMPPRAGMRYIFTYKQMALAAAQLKSLYELQQQSPSQDSNLVIKQLTSSRQLIASLDMMTRQYQQYAEQAKLYPQDLETFVAAAYDSGVLNEDECPRISSAELHQIAAFNQKHAQEQGLILAD